MGSSPVPLAFRMVFFFLSINLKTQNLYDGLYFKNSILY